MSRSFRHTPIRSIAGCKSESIDKKIWHKAMRRSIHVILLKNVKRWQNI